MQNFLQEGLCEKKERERNKKKRKKKKKEDTLSTREICRQLVVGPAPV